MSTTTSGEHAVLREKRKTIARQMDALYRGRFDLAARAQFECLDHTQREIAQRMREIEPDSITERRRARDKAFDRYLRHGLNENPERGDWGLSSEDRAIMTRASYRDLGTGSAYPGAIGPSGAFFVPEGFSGQVESQLRFASDLFDVATIWKTPTGNQRAYPNDTDEASSSGELLPEGAQATSQDIAGVSQVVFNSFKISSRLVKISQELAQDAGFDLQAYLAERFSVRIARAATPYLTSGTGVDQPTGITTAATVGLSQYTTPAIQGNDQSGSPNPQTQIGFNDLLNLESSLDPSYRRRNASYMMHPTTLTYIKSIKDQYGRPLWLPGLSSDAPDRILGYDCRLNNGMAQLGAGAITVLFGALNKFLIRMTPPAIVRLTERWVEYGQVGYVLYTRIDSNLLSANASVKLAQQHI